MQRSRSRGYLLQTIVDRPDTAPPSARLDAHEPGRVGASRTPEAALSGLARQALESPAPRRVEVGHLLGEVAERDVPVLRNQILDLRPRPQGHVLISVVPWCIEIGLTLAAANEDALLVQPRHDRHVGRVSALLARALIQRLHDRSHG